MRQYRTLLATGPSQDTRPVETAIIFYVGWLGHSAGDRSQLLHVTVNYSAQPVPDPYAGR